MDESFVWLGAHTIGGPTAWLDVNLRAAAPLDETLLMVAELTTIDNSSTPGRLKLFMRSRLFQIKSLPGKLCEFETDGIKSVVNWLEGGAGVLVCDATTLVISAADHNIAPNDPFYARCFTNEQRASL